MYLLVPLNVVDQSTVIPLQQTFQNVRTT